MSYYLPVLSFLLCVTATPLVRMIALKNRWVAQLSTERWHSRVTALLGGMALYLAFSVPLIIQADFSTVLHRILHDSQPAQMPSFAAASWLGMTFVFGLGLVDDFWHIKPQTKLIGQIVAASLITFLGFRLNWFESLTLDILITIIWIVGITNALNLIDNMDGLCAGVGLIAAVFWAAIYAGHAQEPALVAMVLAAGLAAFLIFNFSPASIFMGDCGSLQIGFALAVLSLPFSTEQASNSVAAYAVPVLILLVPIFDTTLVTLIRILSGRNASTGGRDHASHRLVLMGFSERRSVLVFCGISIVSGFSAVFVSQSDTLTSPLVIIPVVLAVLLMGVFIAKLRVYPEAEFCLLRDRSYSAVLFDLTYKRQLLMVLLDFGLIAFSYYVSYRLRFSAEVFPYYFKVFLRSLPAVIICKFAAFFALGIYRGQWTSMGVSDVFTYFKASTLATILSVTAVTYIFRFADFSKGIFLIDWLLTYALLICTRGSFRVLDDVMKRRRAGGDRMIIYGAGRGGEILLRELLNNKNRHVKPIGFIDDDRFKVGKNLHGYPILGTFQNMDELTEKHAISGLLISFEKRDPRKLQAIKEYCRKRRLFLKTFSITIDDIDLEPNPSHDPCKSLEN